MGKIVASILISTLMLVSGMTASANPNVAHLSGKGPADGEFSAWTKQMANGNQIKFYAKYMQSGQKVQFMVQNASGRYEQFAWKRVEAEDLNPDGSYADMQNHIYFIRTLDLKPGKNRVRILVDGELYWGSKTYLIKELPSTSETPLSELSAVEKCKIDQADASAGLTVRSGFPAHPDYELASDKKIVVQMLFVDFSDLPSTEKPEDDAGFFTEGAGKFLRNVTEGVIDFEFRHHSDFVRLPKPIKDYEIIRGAGGDPFVFVQDAITESDSYVDFSEVDIVIAIPPAEVNDSQMNYSPAIPLTKTSAFTTDEGLVYRGTMVGSDVRSDEDYFSIVAHEIGHLLGLQDYYSYDWKPGDAYEDLYGFFGGFDNMSYAFPKVSEWSAWSRFLLGVLEDEQIRCVTDEPETTHRLTAIGSSSPGSKAVVIPTGDHTGIVVESRKSIRHDKGLPKEYEGLLVYRVDTTKPNGFGPLEIVRKPNLSDPYLLDAPLRPGEEIVVDGIKVENMESGSDWDMARISQGVS